MSWASENQLLIGTACCGWKMYEVGELSMMMVSRRSRPTWERSFSRVSGVHLMNLWARTDLYVIALMIVTAFAEEAMMDYFVDVKLVK